MDEWGPLWGWDRLTSYFVPGMKTKKYIVEAQMAEMTAKLRLLLREDCHGAPG